MGMKLPPDLEAKILRRCQHDGPAGIPSAPLLDLGCSEKKFQAWVIARAKERRWLVYHTHDSRKSPGGFPDLVLARGGNRGGNSAGIIFAELKTLKGKVNDEQREWLDVLDLSVLAAFGVTIGVYLWRPTDAEDILRILA